MGFLLPLGFTVLLLALFVVRSTGRRSRSKNHPPFPPGPPADPIIGHLRHISPEDQDKLFYEWGKIYGDVIYVHVLGQPIIVLNSVQAAVDLLEKKSAIYSDRPRFFVYELMGFTKYVLVIMRYGKKFQRHRQMMHEYFNEKKCMPYRPVQLREARVFLQNLVESQGVDLRRSIERFSAAIIIKLAFGHQIVSDDDPYVKVARDASFAVENAGPPGGTSVDVFPFLQYFPSWFPGRYYVNFARDHMGAVKRLFEYPLGDVQKQMATGTAKPSFMSYHLEALNNQNQNVNKDKNIPYPYTVEDIKGASGTLYIGAADTTTTSLLIFFLAMTLHPECQLRAQEEIDAVLGSGGRLPDFSDRESLRYVDCIIQETLRWNNPVPLAPHRATEDDVYRGMFIPKGAMVISNTRGITLDENIYKDPHRFNPARYLPKPEGNGEPFPVGPFGFGRRICPGRHLADASLWIAIASVLAVFRISKVVGEDGREVEPEVKFTCGIVSQPRPYRCRVLPRSEAAKRLVAAADTWDGY